MAVLLTVLGTAMARADITVKVMKGGTAPHLYAYTGSGAGATKLTGDWPGTQFTEKDANDYWTMTVEDANTINLIFNMNGNSQTGDITDVSGVDGVATFVYDGAGKALPTMPAGTYQAGKVAYFACPPSWDTNNLKSQIVHNGHYEEHSMTYIGIDGAGNKVYADLSFTGWNDTPQQIHFYDNAGKEAGMFTYYLGGYYTTGGLATQMTNLSSGNGYTDDNFRAGIASQLGISDGDVFAPSAITYLDVSGCGITSLAGIANFTNLQTLIASNNSLTCTKTDRSKLNLSSNTNLEVLNVNGNSAITSIDIAALPGLSHLEMNNCNINDDQTFAPAGTHNALTYLDMSNNTTEKGFSWHQYLPNLETLIVANANIKPTGFTQGTNYFSGMSNLKYLDVSDCPLITSIYLTGAPNLETLILNKNTSLQSATATSDGKLVGLNTLAKLKHVEFTDVDLGTNNLITNLAASKGTLEYLDLSRATMISPSMSGFTALKAFKAAGNYNLPSGSSRYSLTTLTINDSPLLSSIDLTGDQGLVTLNLTNIGRNNDNIDGLFTGLTDCTALEMMNFDGNGFTSVPAFGHSTYTSLKLNKNALTSIDMSGADPGVQFLYAEQNGLGGDVELTATSAGPLKGLDLGNNGITSFKAEGTTLSALMIGDNPAMTTLELHGNDNLTCTTAGTTMSDGSGLYVKGNTALKTIDLSNSSFTQIGADNAMLGLTAVETLNGSHNKFTTFTNSNYDIVDNNGNSRLKSYVTGKSSLEDLTGLKHLDLSYNEIADSVHLYRNTLLEYLDVSHNNKLGELATTDAEKLAMRLRKADLMRKYHNKTTPIGISCAAATQATLTANETECKQPGRSFDYRDKDLRDTTGLFHLDLNYNVELKYLDISETNINNTAAGWTYMCPGWEIGTGGWYSTTTTSTTPARSPANGSTRHHFVWLQTCGKLEEFHADNNSMQSLGLSTSPYLHTITAKGMHGDCYFMRDNKAIGNGNITISGSIAVYDHTVYSYNENNELTGTIYYRDASGAIGVKKNLTNFFPNPVKWYDVSNSDYYIVRTANGADLEHLDVSGNHLSELKVSDNTKLQYVDTENNDRLTYVDANDLPDLTTLKVADNPMLEKLYADNDPSLPSISGLDDCTALKYLHVQNNGLFGSNDFNVEANTNLQALLASNCNLPGELKVSQCAALDTLSVFDNQITTLDVSALDKMHWLDCYNNQIAALVPGTSTGMTHLDLHNNLVRDLLVGGNTAMQYFDCDNNSIRELDFHGATGIQTLHANSNNLFHIKMGSSHSSLADMQFKNNHINGIDLSGCNSAVLTNLEDENNGRTIVANGAVVNGKNMFYFQLKSIDNGGYFLDNMKCNEDTDENGRTSYQGSTQGAQSLTADGFDQTKVVWNEAPFSGTRGKFTGTRAEDYGLTADKVIGTIVVLEESAPGSKSGSETYQYKNGLIDDSTSEFYLNWVANAENIVTDIDDLESNQLVIVGSQGCILINASKAMPITVADINGRIVAQREVENGETTIDGLAAGIYIVNGNKVVVK